MVGFDFKDFISINVFVFDFIVIFGKDIKGFKIGILVEYWVDGMFDEIDCLWVEGKCWFEDVGVMIVDILLFYI